MRPITRVVLVLALVAGAALSACSSPPPAYDGSAARDQSLERASRAQDELSGGTGGR
jgi:starvation-inducible outer membrane lipoprotein